jgi:predicted MPP superfamily phosphohydrolase
MQRPFWLMLAFGSVLILLIAATHLLLYNRLVVATQLPAPYRQFVASLLLVLGVSLPVGFAASRLVDAPWMRGWAWVSFLWMGLVFLLLLGVAAAGLLDWSHGKVSALRGVTVDDERRLFLARLFGGAAAGGALLAGATAFHYAFRRPPLRRVEVALKKLPKGMDGLTIVQVSDLHVGPTIRRDWVQALVDDINALQPDVVALTGDMTDGSVEALRDHVAPFAQVKAKRGVFLVTGNHEYFSGADAWIAEWQRLGVQVLRNERVTIGEGEQAFDLAGVDDWTAHRLGAPGHGHDLGKALLGRHPEREVVLLAHQPKSIHQAAELGVGLQLSGHTHGGQIWPFGWVVALVQPYVAGLYQHGDTQIYVSRGTGYWGPPMRLAAPSELTQVVLKAA